MVHGQINRSLRPGYVLLSYQEVEGDGNHGPKLFIMVDMIMIRSATNGENATVCTHIMMVYLLSIHLLISPLR
jgi:hypothetical protein